MSAVWFASPEEKALPDRKAQERLADWRTAERAEGGAEGGTDRRRAAATSRRARWAFEDAARAAGEDHGVAEADRQRDARSLRRLAEATDGAAALQSGQSSAARKLDTSQQREKTGADEAEMAEELDPLEQE